MKAIVVGGGIAGSFTSFFLAQQGIDVTVVSGTPTYPGVGLVLSVLLASPSDVRLAARSLAIYRHVEETMGRRIIYPFPVYEVFPGDARIPPILMNTWRTIGENVGSLSPAEARREAGLRLREDEWVLGGGRDYVISVRRVVGWLHERLGVLKGFARLRKTRHGIEVLYKGSVLKSDVVVVAAGAWNKELLLELGYDPPLVTYGARALLLLGPRILSRISLSDNVYSFYSRPTDRGILNKLGLYLAGDGNVPRVSPGSKWSIDGGYVEEITRAVRLRLGKTPIHVKRGRGVVEMGLDHFPVAGCLDEDEGLYIIGGLNGYGATIGPALAEALARAVAKGSANIGLPCHDASRFPRGGERGVEPSVEWEPFLLYPPPPPTTNTECFPWVEKP